MVVMVGTTDTSWPRELLKSTEYPFESSSEISIL